MTRAGFQSNASFTKLLADSQALFVHLCGSSHGACRNVSQFVRSLDTVRDARYS